MKKYYISIIFLLSLTANAIEFPNLTQDMGNALEPLTAKSLWLVDRQISPAIYSLTRYLERNCREYEILDIPYPTKEVTEQCAFIEIFKKQEMIMGALSTIEHVELPEDQEWDSIFSGIMAPVFDFESSEWQPYHLIADIILNQVAIETGIKHSKSLQGPIFQTIEYPAIVSSLFPGDRLTYYLRASLVTQCQNSFYDCRKLGGLSKQESIALLNRLYIAITQTYVELLKTKSTEYSLENWLLSKRILREEIDKIRASSYSAEAHLLAQKNGEFLPEHHLLASLIEKNNVFNISLPKPKYLDAILALVEIDEIYTILKTMGYPDVTSETTHLLSEQDLLESPYTNNTMKKLISIRKLFQL